MTAHDRTESYRYDLTGNIVSSSGTTVTGVTSGWEPDAATGPRQYAGNTLLSAGVEQYSHDAQGRLVSRSRGDQTWQYSWDTLDRLTGVRTLDGARWRYRYDPLGRRIAKQRLAPDDTVAEQIEFVWDGTVLVEQVHTDPTGNQRVTTWEHHPEADRPLVQLEQDAVDQRFYTIVTDLVGTPVQLFDERGTLAWRSRASLWGSALPSNGDSADTPLRFPGQYHDAETGLHYNVYRYYDPATGRYVSQDPLGLEPAPNPMAYVGNPLSASDPLGLTPDESCTSSNTSTDGKKRPRAGSDSDNAASTSSNKKQNTGKDFKPGDKVNSDLKGPAVDTYKAEPSNKKHSEALGEAGALDYLHKTTGNDNLTLHTATKQNPLDTSKYGLEHGKPWPHAVAFNGANVSDVAHWDGKTLHVVEAKGGGSQLTGGDMHGRVQKYDHDTGDLRPYADRVNDPRRMDQGSDTYLTDVGHAMKNSKITDGRQTIGQAILDGQRDGVVKYVPVGTSVYKKGNAVVKVLPGYGE